MPRRNKPLIAPALESVLSRGDAGTTRASTSVRCGRRRARSKANPLPFVARTAELKGLTLGAVFDLPSELFDLLRPLHD